MKWQVFNVERQNTNFINRRPIVNTSALIEKIIKKVFELIGKCLVINPGDTSRYVTWINARDYYRALISADERPVETPGPKLTKWKREESITKVGFLCIESASVLSTAHPKGPSHRHVLVFSKGGRPLKTGRNHNYFYKFFEIIRSRPRTKRHIKGSAALLGSDNYAIENYFHFWTDVIADHWFLANSNIAATLPDYYIIPFSGSAWQKEILSLCRISEDRVIPTNSFNAMSIERLIVPIRNKGGRLNHAWVPKAMRECVGWRQCEKPPFRKIYVSRQDASRRPLKNEDVIIDIMKAKGFEVVECSSLTVTQQKQLFSECKIVVAPHGAALTNVVWMSPGTMLFEFMPNEVANPCFRDFARQLGINYSNIPAFGSTDGGPSWRAAIQIDMDLFNEALEQIGQR